MYEKTNREVAYLIAFNFPAWCTLRYKQSVLFHNVK